MTSFVGTAYATAPEVFKNSYTSQCDLWAVGVITYAMLCGMRPFVGREMPSVTDSKYKSMVRSILTAAYSWPRFSTKLSAAAKSFVDGLLVADPGERMGVKQALNHPFIQQAVKGGNYTESLTPLIPQIGEMSKVRDETSEAIHIGCVILTVCKTKDQCCTFSARRFVVPRFLAQFSELKKNAMMAVAFSLSQNQMEDLRDCFTSIDTDHSGTLTKEEFAVALRKVMPTLEEKKISEVFSAIDQDNNGEISYLEFLAATMHKNNLSVKELEDAFKILDHDGNGYLEPRDFEALLGDTDKNDRERIKKMLEEADANGDGKVSFAEFMVAMGNSADLEIGSAGVELGPIDAVSVQAEKRKNRLQKTSTFKRHKSDSVLEIESMKEIDKELQAMMPSPATSTVNVSYRLRGQNSDGKKEQVSHGVKLPTQARFLTRIARCSRRLVTVSSRA